MSEGTLASRQRDRILGGDDSAQEVVKVPEWGEGEEVMARALTGNDAREITRYSTLGEAMPFLVVRGTYSYDPETEEVGELLFEPAHTDELMGKSSAPLLRIAETVSRISGVQEKEKEELGKG